MTATEDLRRMLDERGVEYDTYDEDGCEFTEWDGDGYDWVADSRGKLVYLSHDRLITPAQAIEATLGRGTCEYCKDGKFDGQTVMMSNHGWQRINFCPNCGARCVG